MQSQLSAKRKTLREGRRINIYDRVSWQKYGEEEPTPKFPKAANIWSWSFSVAPAQECNKTLYTLYAASVPFGDGYSEQTSDEGRSTVMKWNMQ
jgi:hypothetical protein